MQLLNFKSIKTKIFWIVLVAALAWASSITNEFVGYDDIKLIVRNDRVQSDIFYTIKFYWNIVSDSHNIAWTNFPSVIYRPLEWSGSAIGYHIWGPRAWAFHFFVNYSFHIINGIILFFILTKLFGTPINGDLSEKQAKPLTKLINKKKQKIIPGANSVNISWWVPFVVILLWAVHPFHHEAVNMLTSGVGFLSACLLCFTSILINLYVKDLRSLRGIALIILAWIISFISYHGSEMTVIAPLVLAMLFICKRQGQDYGYEIPKVLFHFSAFLTYMAHRASIVSEQKEWMSGGASEFFERIFILVPEVFFHYIRLFFFPNKLTIDQHHNVILANAFTPYHLLCLIFGLAFVALMIYFFFNKDQKFYIHNKIIAGGLFFTVFGIAISLNIFPLYCLARDRYTYFFTLGLFIALVTIVDKYFFAKPLEANPEAKINAKPWIIILIILLVTLSARSFVKSFDWRNGERFWSTTMDSVDDFGTKQNWRYRLLQYYLDTGTTTFVPNQTLRTQAQRDFDNFPIDFNLADPATANYHLGEAKNPEKYMLNKYAYIGNKTIASGLFFNAVEAFEKGDAKQGLEYFRLAHIYYPEHFQTNLQLFIHTWGSNNAELSNYLLGRMEKQAMNNSFLAKGLMDSLFFIKHPRTFEYAEIFKHQFPNTQVFQIYLFHGCLMKGDYDRAYREAKLAMIKYHEGDDLEQFVRNYELGAYQQQNNLMPQSQL